MVDRESLAEEVEPPPALDTELAKGGIMFEKAVALTAWTGLSMGGLLP